MAVEGCVFLPYIRIYGGHSTRHVSGANVLSFCMLALHNLILPGATVFSVF